MPADNHKSAHQAPRCQHQLLNGLTCAQPALRGRKLCRFHDTTHRQKDYSLPLVEDATSLQFALMQVMRAIADNALDTKRAALMLYALQISAMNLKRLSQERPGAYDPAEESLAALLLREINGQETAPDKTAVIEAIQAAAARLPAPRMGPKRGVAGRRAQRIAGDGVHRRAAPLGASLQT